MGVPVVTVAGSMHMARVGVSLLSGVELLELIASDLDGYVEKAVSLARDLPRLRELRGGMRERLEASPLRDEMGFARDVEKALRGIWQDWCAAATRPSGSSDDSRAGRAPRA